MGINTTPTNYKSFTFDGRSSREFGVYTTGEGVFNAPERAVEMISIPARNGDYALDLGHFENIEVTYRCGIVADNETDFAEAVSDFRNWLCSRRGYCRLQDEYNTDEFRMGIFKNVVNVEHDGLQTGEFDVTFDCKPQRWLTSGETETEITSGNSITNPTLFASSPLLEVWGGGTIAFNGQQITIESEDIGDVIWHNSDSTNNKNVEIVGDGTFANVGDDIDVSQVRVSVSGGSGEGGAIQNLTNTVTGDVTGSFIIGTSGTSLYGNASIVSSELAFVYGTSKTITGKVQCSYTVDGHAGTRSKTINITLVYDGDSTFTVTITTPTTGVRTLYIGDIILHSTQTTTGSPAYIDLDIGECYKVESGSVVSINNAVTMPSDLPTFPPGETEITFSDITQLKVVPRWWKV